MLYISDGAASIKIPQSRLNLHFNYFVESLSKGFYT